MALKYNCPNCGVEIITAYLKPSDSLACPGCKAEINVPPDAVRTDEEPNIIKKRETGEILPPSFLDSLLVSEEQKTPAEPTVWGVADVLKFIGLYLLGIISMSCILTLITAAILAIIAPNVPAWPSNWKEPYQLHYYNALSIIIDALAIWLIYYIVAKRHHNTNFFEVLHLYKVPRALVIRYFLIALGTLIFIFGLYVLVTLTPIGKYIPKNLPIDELLKNGYPALIWFTIMGPLAAVPEEIIFRGFIYLGLKQSYGQMRAAVIVTLIFILLHGPQLAFSPFHLLLIGIGAVIFITVRIKTDSLTRSMLVHFFYNFIIAAFLWTVVIIYGISVLKNTS